MPLTFSNGWNNQHGGSKQANIEYWIYRDQTDIQVFPTGIFDHRVYLSNARFGDGLSYIYSYHPTVLSYLPDFAIDGTIGIGNFAHSSTNQNPTFLVDLPDSQTIVERVIIYPRQGCCFDKYSQMRVKIDNNYCETDQSLDANTIQSLVNGGAGIVFQCNTSVKGSTIIVENGNDFLHFTEIEAAGAIPIDQCSPNPCQNGATCTDGVNTYTCNCLAGYEGDRCEISLDVWVKYQGPDSGLTTKLYYTASSAQDKSWNDCRDTVCPELGGTFASITSQHEQHFVESNDFQDKYNLVRFNGRTSIYMGGYDTTSTNGQFVWLYGKNSNNEPADTSFVTWWDYQVNYPLVDYHGLTMVVFSDSSISSKWYDNRVDIRSSGSYVYCLCQKRYRNSMDGECLNDPCLNGASCSISGSGSRVCNCVAGYSGRSCEINIDECSPNPCQNGATCTDGVNTYTCNCLAGYEGDKCEISKGNWIRYPGPNVNTE